MNIPFVDLKAQYQTIEREINQAIKEVLENTAFIGGEHVESFKKKFQIKYDVKHCVPLANGTDALYVAMKMMGIGTGDEVITTASSWISTSETISQTGAQPVFVDVDKYYTIDVSKIESKITNKTKAIIPVHLYGQMADMPEIIRIANKFGLKVIEDCAQSHFSELNGKRAGLWGHCGTFSFYPGKNLGAYGDAGCLITNQDKLAEDCQRYANHGALEKHHHEIEGINSRMDGIQAAVLNVKLPHILDWTEKRQQIAEFYSHSLKSVEDIKLPLIRENSKHSFHVYAITVKDRNSLKNHLKQNGVDTQIHYPKAMPFMPAYAYQSAQPMDYPNSYNLQENELSLPIFPEMTNEQIEYISMNVRNFLKK